MESDSESRRGPKLFGEKKRQRFNLSLDPDVVQEARKLAEKDEKSFSLWVEGLIKTALQKPSEDKDAPS